MSAVSIYLTFLATYLGMGVGRLPWLRVDRTGIALVGLILLLATQALTLDEIGARIDLPTLLLLFALMIISAQFVAAGFCERVYGAIGRVAQTPLQVLALVIAYGGGLAAFLANDIMVAVSTPLVLELARSRGLDPKPYLIALIGASNAGSAATIIGAPQTIVIGQLGNLRFPSYLLACAVPSVMTLILLFAVLAFVWRGRLTAPDPAFEPAEPGPPIARRSYDRVQTNKGILALGLLIALFSTGLPKDLYSLPIAAILLLTRRYSSRELIGGVDWPLLLLIACLFGVTGALGSTAVPGLLVDWLERVGLLPDNLALLAPLTLAMSCTIGNVPGTILFLQLWQTPPSGALYALALLSTLAGNLLVIASLSNIVIVERAEEFGVRLKHREFAAIGVPVTLLSLGFAIFWLYITGFVPLLPGGGGLADP